MLSPKTIKNAIALLSSILEAAAADYELLDGNPLRGMLRRTQFPSSHRQIKPRVRILELDDFQKALNFLDPRAREMVLVAALTGLRWGELIALRIHEDVDFRRNKLRITRSLYRRTPQTPKTAQSVREVDMCPTVRRILERIPWTEGLVFSPDGKAAIGDGSWLKRQWRDAQLRAGVVPITWHDLRHQFVSLLIAADKHPKYIATQAGHGSAGFTLDRYGHLLEGATAEPVEWIDDFLGGWEQIKVLLSEGNRRKARRSLAIVQSDLQANVRSSYNTQRAHVTGPPLPRGLVARFRSPGGVTRYEPAIAKMPGKQRGGKEERIPSRLIPQNNSSQWSLMPTK